MRVAELARAQTTTCTPATTLAEAAHLMRLRNVGSLPVVDDAGAVKGIVTDRDIALKGYGQQLEGSTPVERIMSAAVVTVTPDADTTDAATKMVNSGVRRLPVVDGGGALCGMISLDDLLILAEQEGDTLRRALASQIRKDEGGWAGGWD